MAEEVAPVGGGRLRLQVAVASQKGIRVLVIIITIKTAGQYHLLAQKVGGHRHRGVRFQGEAPVGEELRGGRTLPNQVDVPEKGAVAAVGRRLDGADHLLEGGLVGNEAQAGGVAQFGHEVEVADLGRKGLKFKKVKVLKGGLTSPVFVDRFW